MTSAQAPLKRLAHLNALKLAESTPGDAAIRYVDIGSVTRDGEVRDVQDLQFSHAPSRARMVVRPGDTIVSTVRTYLRAVAHFPTPDHNLICSTGFAVLSPTPRVEPRYLYYAVRSDPVINEVVARSVGVSYPAIRPADLGSISVLVPNRRSQRAIADFLDRETGRIDALVEKKRRLIELLEEKRTALISHVVTKGLDPTVPMKYPGIPWLGTIPRHWDAAPVYSRYRVFLGKMLSKEAAAGPNQRPYLRNVNVQWDHMSLADVATMSFTEAERHKYRLRYGDLLVCEGGDVGRAAIWADELPDCYFQKALLMVRPRMVGELPRFLLMVLRAAASMNVFNVEGNQATFVHLTGEKLRGHRFGFPPAAEQSAIVQHIDRRTTNIDKTISRLQQQLALLAEHRQALITAAVTGQIDVKAQASDPEEVMS